MASIAKIWISDGEAEELAGDLSPLFEMADSLAGAEMGVDESAAGAAPLGHARSSVPVDALREDIARPIVAGAAATDIYYEQSPSGGSDGFTIPRLLD